MTDRERRLHADTHYERCNGINCPCYNEGRRSGRAEGPSDGLSHPPVNGGTPQPATDTIGAKG